MRLPSTWRFASPGCATTASICPPNSAGDDCPQPAKGTGVIFVLVRKMNSSRLRWLAVPSPGVPTRIFPGFAFASATNSWMVFHGDSAFHQQRVIRDRVDHRLVVVGRLV